MRLYTIAGKIALPKEPKQKELHRQLNGFISWIERTKDASEVQRDKRQPVPIAMLPMVF